MDHGNTNLPTLVRLVSKDGNLVKEYRLHFKSTFQTTPTEGVKNLVAEAPSLEIEKTPLPFKEVIRETPELAQGQRRVVSEGQAGEKVDYIQVSGTNRTLVHSEQRKAQDRIIEVGVQPSISNSKGEEPAPVNEVPEFKGGANFVEAAVNAVPEYTGILAIVGDQAAPTVEKPEFKLSSLEKAQTPEVPVQVVKEDKRLPETGEKQSETAIFLAGVTLALSAALLTAKRKED